MLQVLEMISFSIGFVNGFTIEAFDTITEETCGRIRLIQIRDLELIPSLNDVKGIPTEGKNLIIVAAVNNVLHFRIFDRDGKKVKDANEKELTEQARQIDDLKEQLDNWWPPHKLTDRERFRGIIAVTSILGHTLLPKGVPFRFLFNKEPFPCVNKKEGSNQKEGSEDSSPEASSCDAIASGGHAILVRTFLHGSGGKSVPALHFGWSRRTRNSRSGQYISSTTGRNSFVTMRIVRTRREIRTRGIPRGTVLQYYCISGAGRSRPQEARSNKFASSMNAECSFTTSAKKARYRLAIR